MLTYKSSTIDQLENILYPIAQLDFSYTSKNSSINDHQLYYINKRFKKSQLKAINKMLVNSYPDEKIEELNKDYILILAKYKNCWSNTFEIYFFNKDEIKEICTIQDIFNEDEIKYCYSEDDE